MRGGWDSKMKMRMNCFYGSRISFKSCEREAEFSDVIGTKVLRVFLLVIHCHLYERISPPHTPGKMHGL
jgi:hypothetical protein